MLATKGNVSVCGFSLDEYEKKLASHVNTKNANGWILYKYEVIFRLMQSIVIILLIVVSPLKKFSIPFLSSRWFKCFAF